MKKAGDNLNKTSWKEAISIIKDRLALLKRSKEIDKLAVVGSAFASNEENYLLHKIFHGELDCDKFFICQNQNEPQHEDEVFKSNFTIHADKSPNQKGANLFLGDKTDFWQAIKKGDIEVLIFFGNDLNLELSDQQKDLLKKLDFLAVLDIAVTDFSNHADVALPITYFAEQDGSYINFNNQLQKFKKAINPPEDVQPGWQVLLSIYKAFNEKIKMVSVSDIVNDMAENVKAFKGISFFKIGDQGVQVS